MSSQKKQVVPKKLTKRQEEKAAQRAEARAKIAARAEFDARWKRARDRFLELDRRRTSGTATQQDLDDLLEIRKKLARMRGRSPVSYDVERNSRVVKAKPRGGVRFVVQGGSPGSGKRA